MSGPNPGTVGYDEAAAYYDVAPRLESYHFLAGGRGHGKNAARSRIEAQIEVSRKAIATLDRFTATFSAQFIGSSDRLRELVQGAPAVATDKFPSVGSVRWACPSPTGQYTPDQAAWWELKPAAWRGGEIDLLAILQAAKDGARYRQPRRQHDD